MSLVAVKEKAQKSNFDSNGTRTYTRTFQVEVTEANADPYTVGTYCNIDWNDPFPGDVTARARTADATQSDTDLSFWTVTINYSNAPVDIGATTTGSEPAPPSGEPAAGGTQAQEPTARPWQVSCDTVEVSVPLEEDAQVPNKALTTSAGQPFDPPVEVPSYRAQLTINGFKAIGSDSFANVGVYTGKVNEDGFMGYAAGTLLCKKYALQSQYEHGSYFWSKTVVLEVKLDKWNPIRVLDQGTIERVSGDPSLGVRPILDQTGNPVTSPVPLNGGGMKLGMPDILAGNFVFREFNAYKKISFAGIL